MKKVSDETLIKRFMKGKTEGESKSGLFLNKDYICWHRNTTSCDYFIIASRLKKCGIDFVFNSNKNTDCAEQQKLVLSKLDGVIVHLKDAVICDIECRACRRNLIEQFEMNESLIKELKKLESRDLLQESKVKWLQEQNKLLEPIVVLFEL